MAALCSLLTSAQTILGPTNTTWNYESQGSDWGTAYANCKASYYAQAPLNLTNINETKSAQFSNYIVYDWKDYGYSYLPDFETGAVATWYGIEQYLYRIYGSFGGIYAAEP